MERQNFKPTSRADLAPNHYEMARDFNSLYVEILKVGGIFDNERPGTNKDFADLVGMFRQSQLGENASKANEWVWDEAVIPTDRFELERDAGTILGDIVAPLFAQAVWANVKRGQIETVEKLFAVQIAMAGSFVEAEKAQTKTTRQQFATQVAKTLSEDAFWKALALRNNTGSDRVHFEEMMLIMDEVGISANVPPGMDEVTVSVEPMIAADTIVANPQDDEQQWIDKMHPHGFTENDPDDPNRSDGARL